MKHKPITHEKKRGDIGMVEAICSNCGAPWRTGQTKCACGGTNKTFQQQPFLIKQPISVSLLKTATTTVVEKYRGWIVIYILVQMVLAVVSYWTSEWVSVGWSVLGSIVSTVIGLFIVAKVITRTSN